MRHGAAVSPEDAIEVRGFTMLQPFLIYDDSFSAFAGAESAHKFEDGIRETIRWYLDNQVWVKTVLAKSKD